MHMLRWTRIFVALIAVLAVGVVLIRLGDTLRQDEAVFGWSNALVWMEVGTTFTPRFRSQARLDDPRPNVCVVSGEIALPDSDGGETWGRYVAVVRQVCNARWAEKCWVLQSLTLGGAVVEIQLAEDTAPAAETIETDGPDLTMAEASTSANGVATGGKPSGPEENRLVETEVNPFVEEAAQTTGEVSIVIDDADNDVSEAPKAADSAAGNKATGTIEVSVINTENKVNRIVFLIQDRLNRLGYAKPTPLELDGQFGPRTREAIAIYQQAHGLKIDGRASRELLHHIERRGMKPAQGAELKMPSQVTVVKAPSQGGFRVQLGAFKSSEGAPKFWRTLQSRHSDLLGGLEHQIRRVDAGDRGIFYYLYAGPLPTESSAHSLCHTLIERKVDCRAVKP